MIANLKLLFSLLCIITILAFIRLLIKNYDFNIVSSLHRDNLIPNTVHYIFFDESTINFITYLSLLSVIKIQKPSVIYIHANKNFTGKYWDDLVHIASKSRTDINISFLIQPTHVYGQRLSSIYHASDIARLSILLKHGGIYLDTDMVIINNVNKLRIYDCVIGLPKNDYVGSQFIMAKRNSQFLQLWRDGYKKYRPTDWYYNAGRYPTALLEKYPNLAHVEHQYFGVQYLLDKLLSAEQWDEWKRYYGIHILSRHDKLFRELNETSVQHLPINFAVIAKWILNY